MTVAADLAIAAQLAGQSLASNVSPSMAFAVDDIRAAPVRDRITAEDTPITTNHTGTLTGPAGSPATASLSAIEMPVKAARAGSVVGVVGALALAVAGALLARRGRHVDAVDRIEHARLDNLIDVDALSPAGARAVVAVQSLEQLAGYAEDRQLPVLRVLRTGEVTGYVVDDGTVRYQYHRSSRAAHSSGEPVNKTPTGAWPRGAGRRSRTGPYTRPNGRRDGAVGPRSRR